LARAGDVDGSFDAGREEGLPDGADRRLSGRRIDVWASGCVRACEERACDERDCEDGEARGTRGGRRVIGRDGGVRRLIGAPSIYEKVSDGRRDGASNEQGSP